jgi:predicted ATPase
LCVKLGRLTEGLKYIADAGQIVESANDRYQEADMYRVRGDLLNATGDRAAAEQSYHQALVVARRQSTKLFELRAATSLARLWRDQGKRSEAHDLLAPVYAWFTEGFDTPVLKEAKALLDELTAVQLTDMAIGQQPAKLDSSLAPGRALETKKRRETRGGRIWLR